MSYQVIARKYRPQVFGAVAEVTVALLLMILLGPFLAVRAGQTPSERYVVGASIVAPHKPCPIFIGGVASGSPAERAGILPGDRLLAVDGRDMQGADLREAAERIGSDKPGRVTLRLWRKGKEFGVVLQREKWSSILAREGRRSAGQFIVAVDTTEAEVSRMVEEARRRVVGRAFPLHYPMDTNLFYGGFEVVVLADPAQVMVAGLERGPASRADIHQGDVVLSINGVNPAGKSPAELEALLSAKQPEWIKLTVDRVGFTKTIEFELERASDVLKENHRRLVDGTLVPDGLADEDIRCFIDKEKRS